MLNVQKTTQKTTQKQNISDGSTALSVAEEEMAQLLLDYGADSVQGLGMATTLRITAKAFHKAMVRLLLDRGAGDIKTSNSFLKNRYIPTIGFAFPTSW